MIIKDSLKTIALSLIALSFIGVASAWTEPTSNPPADNTSAPLLTEPTAPQTTTGTLQVNGLRNVGGTMLDGNVGIGTGAVPTSKLEVKSTLDEILRLTREDGTFSTIFRQGTDNTFVINNNNKDALTIKDGSIGIGTTSPGGSLQVNNKFYRFNSQVSGYSTPRCACDTGSFGECGGIDSTFNTNDPVDTICYDQFMYYNPSTRRNENKSNEFKVRESIIAASRGSFYIGTDQAPAQPTGLVIKSIPGVALSSKPFGMRILDSSGNNKFVVRSDGMVGIGVDNPSYSLDVSGAGKFSQFVWSPRLVSSSVLTIDTVNSGGADDIIFKPAGSEVMRILEVGGRIGIGTSSPDTNTRLHINGDVRIDGSTTGVDSTPILKGYWQLNINGTNYAVPLYNAVSDWVNKVTIEYTQDVTGRWATEQTKSWTVEAGKTVDSIKVYGSSDDGGYCYAYWNTGHVERYRHDGLFGLYNIDGKWYLQGDPDSPCPSTPSFDNSGNVKICQGTSSSGSFAYGNGSIGPGLGLPSGTTINVKARHVGDPSSENVKCYMDIRYKK